MSLSSEEEAQVEERMAKTLGISRQTAKKVLENYNQEADAGTFSRGQRERAERLLTWGMGFMVATLICLMAALALLIAAFFFTVRKIDTKQNALVGASIIFMVLGAGFIVFSLIFGHLDKGAQVELAKREAGIQYLLEEENPDPDALGLVHLKSFVQKNY